MGEKVVNLNEIQTVSKDKFNEFETIDLGTIERTDIEYDPKKIYYIMYDTENNNKVNALFGLPVKVEKFGIQNPDRYKIVKVEIDETIYNVIKFSLSLKDFLVFYDEEKNDVFYRRLFLNLIQGYFDPKDYTFWHESNILKFNIQALDTNDDPDDDIKEIYGKILRLGGDLAPIPNIKFGIIKRNEKNEEIIDWLDNRKITINNETEIAIDLRNFEMNNIGTIRFKAYVPGIKDWWMTLYLRVKKV